MHTLAEQANDEDQQHGNATRGLTANKGDEVRTGSHSMDDQEGGNYSSLLLHLK
jgi:hypothetical protein